MYDEFFEGEPLISEDLEDDEDELDEDEEKKIPDEEEEEF